MDDLKVLFPNREVKINDEIVTVKPFKFGDLPKVIQILADFAQVFMTAPELKATVLDGNLKLDKNTVNFIVMLLERGGDKIYQLVSMSSGLPLEKVMDLDFASGIELTYYVYEVNSDFFTKRLMPLVESLKEKIMPNKKKKKVNGEK